MSLEITRVELKEILLLRNLFLQENNFQIRYDACHRRGWSDSYLVTFNDQQIGYGSVKGLDEIKDRDAIFEFYLIPPFRHLAVPAFEKLIPFSGATHIVTQSNQQLLTQILYQFSNEIDSNVILFEDHVSTDHKIDGAIFRPKKEGDKVFPHYAEPEGDFVLELNDEIVASGGFLLHYNAPFADLYMEVRSDKRKQGFGSLLVQEVKRACYLAGRVPAARTGRDNLASKHTLLKAGFRIAGYMLQGKLKT